MPEQKRNARKRWNDFKTQEFLWIFTYEYVIQII